MAVANRTSNDTHCGMHAETLSVGASSADAANRDREFLLALGIEPYDPAAIRGPASRDLRATMINSLAVIQFAALLIALVWMWAHLA